MCVYVSTISVFPSRFSCNQGDTVVMTCDVTNSCSGRIKYWNHFINKTLIRRLQVMCICNRTISGLSVRKTILVLSEWAEVYRLVYLVISFRNIRNQIQNSFRDVSIFHGDVVYKLCPRNAWKRDQS